MTFIKNIKNSISNPEHRIEILYFSSKYVLLGVSLAFFLVYFLTSAKFLYNFLIIFFTPLYVAFLMSYIIFLCIATFYFGKNKIPTFAKIGISVAIITLGIVFLLPVLY